MNANVQSCLKLKAGYFIPSALKYHTCPALCPDSETVSDFKVLYEENDDAEGAKRIIKLNSNPFNMFNDSSKYSYKLLCLNVYDADMKWIYNFNVTDMVIYNRTFYVFDFYFFSFDFFCNFFIISKHS